MHIQKILTLPVDIVAAGLHWLLSDSRNNSTQSAAPDAQLPEQQIKNYAAQYEQWEEMPSAQEVRDGWFEPIFMEVAKVASFFFVHTIGYFLREVTADPVSKANKEAENVAHDSFPEKVAKSILHLCVTTFIAGTSLVLRLCRFEQQQLAEQVENEGRGMRHG